MNYSKKNVAKRQDELNSKKRTRSERRRLGAGQVILILIIGIIVIGFSACVGAFKGVIDSSPEIGDIDVQPKGMSTFVYDARGNQIAKFVSEDSNRIPVASSEVSEDLKHAFVAIEDERFYEHNGIDIQSILRALINGITTGSFNEGGSTITQQLIKNNVFTGWTDETTLEKIRRKLQEQYLAVELERDLEKTMTKEDAKDTILVNYMNTINLGHSTLGIQAASQTYFNKNVSDLDLAECTVLAGITQNPTRYDPINYPENNQERREVVLSNMLDQGYITQSQYDEAISEDVYDEIRQAQTDSDEDSQPNSYFVDALIEQVINDLMNYRGYTETQAYAELYSGGLNIQTTQDPEIQAIADDECNNEDNYPDGTKYLLNYNVTVLHEDGTSTSYNSATLAKYYESVGGNSTLLYDSTDEAQAAAETYRKLLLGDGDKITSENISTSPQPQISLTIEDQKTGYVLAMVGGRGPKTASLTLNRAMDTTRQPGSTFKIVSTYAPALEEGGFTLATVQQDEEFWYDNGIKVNNWYGESYRGNTTVREAITNSMNIIAVKTLTQIGPEKGYEYLQKFGFTTIVDREVDDDGTIHSDVDQSMALGGLYKGVTNYELNGAFATIANGGTYITPKLYKTVTDSEGNVILDSTSQATDENKSYETRQVISEQTAYLLTSAMEDVVSEGTGTAVDFDTTAIAGKTGTTENDNDVWFAGYTPNYTATAWAGYDDATNLEGSEVNLAKTIWRAVMERLPGNDTYTDFTEPSGIVQEEICKDSGQLVLSSAVCSPYTEYFKDGTQPTETCSYHYQAYQDYLAYQEYLRYLEEQQRAAEQAAAAAAAQAAAQQQQNQDNTGTETTPNTTVDNTGGDDNTGAAY